MPGRDNGFVARHYVPLADLDPRLADAMLDALRAEGIAAYVVPSTGELGGYLEVHLPERPRDRLWVDREHHDRAVTLLSAHNAPAELDDTSDAPESTTEPPGLGAPTDATDDVWAQLVAGFDLPSYEGKTPWPEVEDLPPDADRPPSAYGSSDQTLPLESLLDDVADDLASDDGSPVPRRIVRRADRRPELIGLDPTGSGEYDPLSILDEHFVPEPPPPLPRLRRGTRWALASIAVGLVLILVTSLSEVIPGTLALGVLAIAGGFLGLVAMMREDRPSDSDPDDGAVV